MPQNLEHLEAEQQKDSFLFRRAKEREHEFVLLAQMATDLRAAAKRHNIESAGWVNATEVLPLPNVPNWSIGITHGMEDEERSHIVQASYIPLDDPVELFVTPTDSLSTLPSDNPLDEAQFTIIISETGAVDGSTLKPLDYDDIVRLERDVREQVLPLFPLG